MAQWIIRQDDVVVVNNEMLMVEVLNEQQRRRGGYPRSSYVLQACKLTATVCFLLIAVTDGYGPARVSNSRILRSAAMEVIDATGVFYANFRETHTALSKFRCL